MLYALKIGIVAGALALFTHSAQAASLFFVPSSGEFRTGSEIAVDLKIDSEGVGLNAAQATLRFPKETLQVTSVEKANSAFSFWLEEPVFSNEDGVISFIGGAPYGVSGASIQVIKIIFASKGSGTAPITIVDAAIAASDGSGTNILSKTESASFAVSPTAAAPTSATAAPAVPVPQQIVREAASASGLPAKPEIVVPLYPDPTQWHNATDVFNVRWTLPPDVTAVATSLNKQPVSVPEESEGLFDNKSFAALSDGIWHLHVQFRNAIGWGPVAHYRIAVDTQPPLPFELTSLEGEKSDNPILTLNFKTSDALSGLHEYHIRINGSEWRAVPARGFTGSYEIPVETPGKHRIVVMAHDLAGNGVENSYDQETLPIASPAFTFVTGTVFTDEPTGINLKGTALPDSAVLISLKKGDSLVASSTVMSDVNGNWEYVFGDILRSGDYIVSIQNRDARGALSLVVNSPEITVTERPIFQLGPLKLTKGGAIFLLILIIIGGLGGGWRLYTKRREKTAIRVGVAESDATKIFNMLKADVEKLNKAHATPTPADDEFAAQKMKEDVEKMGEYLKKEIKKTKE